MLVTLENAILFSLCVPLVGMCAIWAARRYPNIREACTLVTGGVVFLFVLHIFGGVAGGARPHVTLLEVMPNLPIAFRVEPLGALFGVLASGLWIVNSLYSIGYMRGTAETHQTRFYMSFAVAIMATLGVAFAANLFTLFIFYEVLTLSTFPLVTHKRNEAARKGGRIYLGVLLGTSIGLFLPAIILTYVLTGTTDFALGGILAQGVQANAPIVVLLLGLFAFGIGKAALIPLHPWLPNAMVAPTPVSAFLHAVAVVKAGVFAITKIVLYIFGVDYLAAGGSSDLFMWIAAFSILLASMIAMTKDNLKARLAYSTVSQLSYVTLGAMLATQMGILGSVTQIAAHAFGKMTLFMCAGAIYVVHQKSLISQMRGLGRRMPLTFTAFAIGACSIIGLPPLAGTWPKLLLLWGAADAGHQALFIVLILSSLMNIVYLLTPIIRGFMDPLPEDSKTGWAEAPLFCLVPAWITATGCIALFFFMDRIALFFTPLVGEWAVGG